MHHYPFPDLLGQKAPSPGLSSKRASKGPQRASKGLQEGFKRAWFAKRAMHPLHLSACTHVPHKPRGTVTNPEAGSMRGPYT